MLEGPYDACVVLGGGVENNKPSHYTKSRMSKGIELVMKRHAIFLMLTGSKSELNVMYELAVRNGLPSDRIVVCHPSKTTIGNAYYAKKEAIARGLKSMIIVTSSFHMDRALAIFDSIFGEGYVIVGQPSHEEVDVRTLEREERLKTLIPLLKLFKRGDHEEIMSIARLLGIED